MSLLFHTNSVIPHFLNLRDLICVSLTCLSIRDRLDELPDVWRRHLKQAQDARPTLFRSAGCRIARIVRRRSANGRLRPMRLTEKRRFASLPPRKHLTAWLTEASAAIRAYESDLLYYPYMQREYPKYPSGICRRCGLFRSKIVWDARCMACFQQDDSEIGVEACNSIGLTALKRSHLLFRKDYRHNGVFFKRYRFSDVYETVAAAEFPGTNRVGIFSVGVRTARRGPKALHNLLRSVHAGTQAPF